MGNGGVLLADSGAAVSGTRSDGKAFSIGGGQADALMLEKGSSFTLNAGDTATDTTVNGGLFTARGGSLAGTTTLNNGATLTLSGKTVNNDTLTIREGDALLQGGALTGNRAEMSPEAAGIAACLMTYSHHACRTECYAMTVHYYRLRDYALQHPECSAIMRIID
ncbi:antirestriction protein [Escherichia coli]